jgi:hypothetical protein
MSAAPHQGLSEAILVELADTWEASAGTGERGAAFRECADTIRTLLHVYRPKDCPRAPAPFRFCPDCDGSFPCQLPKVHP